MDYVNLINQEISRTGLDAHVVFNCYQSKNDQNDCWSLRLPDVEFGPRTVVILDFQDFVHADASGIPELRQIERYYRDRSNRVAVLHWPRGLARVYHGPVNLIEFSNHNYRECSALAQFQQHWLPRLSESRTRAWQCLNGRICAHRKVVAGLLGDHPNGTLSLGTEIPLADWDYATYKGTENIDNFLRLIDLYGQTEVNIVTETQYDHPAGIITEKTFQALAAGQIPIVIGHRGIVDELEGLGFDVFRDLVYTAYDRFPDDQRARRAIIDNHDLISGKIDLRPYQHRRELNIQRVLQHPERLAQDLRSNIENLSHIIINKSI